MTINDVAGEGCIICEIFFVNSRIIILCPVFVIKTLKPCKTLETLKRFLKNS